MINLQTAYSFRHAIGSIESYLDLIEQMKMPYAPITDMASTYGWYSWTKECKKRGLKPLLGVSLPVTPSLDEKRPIIDWWHFLPFGDDLVEINRLVTLATEQFHYTPLLTYEQAQGTNCIKVIGNRTDLSLLSSRREYLLAPLRPDLSPEYVEEIRSQHIHWVWSSCNRYPHLKDEDIWEIVCGRNAGAQTYPQHLLDFAEWKDATPWATDEERTQAMTVAENIGQISGGIQKKSSLPEPIRIAPLRQLCENGAKELGIDLQDTIYKERLDKELRLIEEKDYGDYFYIVADIVKWAKARMIVGPARGSSCGSLVCYLLGITTIDPIPYGLIFERFIDTNRHDLPDIDVDFSDQHREKAIQYIRDTYGEGNVSRLGTVNVYRPRSVLNDMGHALGIPKWRCSKLADSFIERSSGDMRAQKTFEDSINELALGAELLREYPQLKEGFQLEGQPHHAGQHASAVVLSDIRLDEIAPLDARNGALMLDKKAAEDLDLLKVDCLGLTQLSILEDALELAGLPMNTLQNLSLDDKEAFKVLGERRAAGIFQFNGPALRSIIGQFRVESFSDIYHVAALARPGCMSSGATAQWIRARNDPSKIEYPHPTFEPYLKETLGVVVYQEQVMIIGKEIGGLDWPAVTNLRRGMSKSLGIEHFNQFGDPWKKGAIAKGISKDKVDTVWTALCKYGSWTFNKSHSVAYGLISYWCCWLKAHYPFEFAAATLNYTSDPDKQLELLRELDAEGFGFSALDKEHSTLRWGIAEQGSRKVLIAPLTNVYGIGEKTARTIMGARSRGEALTPGVAKKLESGRKIIDDLYPISTGIEKVCPDLKAKNILTPPTKMKAAREAIQDSGKPQQILVIGTPTKINVRDQNEPHFVAKRGYKITGRDTSYLVLNIRDDSDMLVGVIQQRRYKQLGKGIVDRGGAGNTLYAFKGTLSSSEAGSLFMIEGVRFLGSMKD